jgi:NADH-quinone oxidoreductase subunit H
VNEFAARHPLLIVTLPKILVLLFVLLTALAYLTWFERKVVAHIQTRWGPYRVGPHGLLQPLADGLKFLFKEDVTPAAADKFAYFLAPFLALSLAITSIAVIPFGPRSFTIFGQETPLGIANLNIGLLILFAITSMGVYGVALAGWSSNSKYPLLGGLRSSAQMISYELALTMSVVGVLLMAGSFNLKKIIEAQSGPGIFGWGGIFSWNIIPQILGFSCFFVAAVSETNRAPFDLPEAESELVAGFHTEYASFKFAMFFIAEYTSMITVSCLCSIMFFGGWLSPFPASWTLTHYFPSAVLIPFGLWVIWDGIRYETLFGRMILPVLGTAITAAGAVLILLPGVNAFIQGPFWLLSKICVFLFVYVWMRGTLPRFRYDQLMAFGWKLLLPLSIANVIVTSFVILAKMQWWGAK